MCMDAKELRGYVKPSEKGTETLSKGRQVEGIGGIYDKVIGNKGYSCIRFL